MTQEFANRIDGDTLRRWMLRAVLLGFTVGAWAAIVALTR
jgi:hypothetical protein